MIPRYRFMSAFEQKIEAPNKDYQYLIFSAEPYENVSFKVSPPLLSFLPSSCSPSPSPSFPVHPNATFQKNLLITNSHLDSKP